MCEYCDFEENGDLPNDRMKICCASFKIPDDEVYIQGNIIRHKGRIVLHCEAGIENYGDIISGMTAINYCPMCGRKLTE